MASNLFEYIGLQEDTEDGAQIRESEADETKPFIVIGGSATQQATGGSEQQETAFTVPSNSGSIQDGTYRLTVINPPEKNIGCLSEETKKKWSGSLKTWGRFLVVTFVFFVVFVCFAVCKLSLFYLEVKLYTLSNNSTATGINGTSPDTTTASPFTTTTTSINDTYTTSCDPENVTKETIVIWLALILVIPYVITFLRCVWISLMNWNYEPNPSLHRIVALCRRGFAIEVGALFRKPPSSKANKWASVLFHMLKYGNNEMFGGCFVFLRVFATISRFVITVREELGVGPQRPNQHPRFFHTFTGFSDASRRDSTSVEVGTGIFLAVAEALSLAFLVLFALPTSPSVGLIFVNSVFMFAVLLRSIKSMSCGNRGANDLEMGNAAVSNSVNLSQNVGGLNESENKTEDNRESSSPSGGSLNTDEIENEAVDNLENPSQGGGGLNDVESGNTAVDSSGSPSQSAGKLDIDESGNAAMDNGETPLQCGGGLNIDEIQAEVVDNSGNPSQSGGGLNIDEIQTEVVDNSGNPSQSGGGLNIDESQNKAVDNSEIVLHTRLQQHTPGPMVTTEQARDEEERTGQSNGTGRDLHDHVEKEMKQLITSLWDIAKNQTAARIRESEMKFEAHIFFDDGCKNTQVQDFALQLLSIIDSMGENADDVDTYILATDADVRFTPKSAMALLDLARRDPTVGAVCGRTHPLGSGPMVWYQKFDYAVGHWYQKVSSGWRLEYTAVSEDSTYCPEEFDEFFNQRRRWGPSTVANQTSCEYMFVNHIARSVMIYQ
uniref:chitin synthase n=1 Tax=Branchiostoma floridae TaxID=7739 RepID=C3ZFI0_BRAFL|eukprot:XP_002592723.1 hypothetical protein BRAFLDRAFT_118402 [Branchiostoma floridae]